MRIKMLSVWFHIKQNFCNDSLIWRLCQLFCKIFGKSINNKQNWESDLIWIFSFQDEPFTSHLPEALFNISRYLLHMIQGGIPHGISKVYPWPLLSVNHCIKHEANNYCVCMCIVHKFDGQLVNSQFKAHKNPR